MRAHIPIPTSRSHGILLPPPGRRRAVDGPVDRAHDDAVFDPLLDVLSAVAERGGRPSRCGPGRRFRARPGDGERFSQRRLKERASATPPPPASPASPASPIGPGAVADPVADLLAQLQSTRSTGWSRPWTGALGTVTGLACRPGRRGGHGPPRRRTVRASGPAHRGKSGAPALTGAPEPEGRQRARDSALPMTITGRGGSSARNHFLSRVLLGQVDTAGAGAPWSTCSQMPLLLLGAERAWVQSRGEVPGSWL